MANSVTSLTQSGLKDWLIQRVSAVILAVYTVVMLGFFIGCGGSDLTFEKWQMFMLSVPMTVLNILSLIALVAHAWIGVWTISTDYLKPFALRLPFQLLFGLASLCYLFWGLQIFLFK